MGTLKFDIFNRGVTVRVSGIIVRDNTLLLIAHKKKGEIYWLLPGGGIKYGESLSHALKREFREELGIGIEVNAMALICDSIEPHGKRHILNVSFRCDYRDGEYRLGRDRRLYDFGFFGINEIPDTLIYPPINGTLVSILKNKKHDLYAGSLWRE
jgi:8-oxo-dGTP diphosphatase